MIKIGNNDRNTFMEETIDMLSIIFGEKNVIAQNPIKCLVYNTFHAKNTFVHFDCHKNLVKRLELAEILHFQKREFHPDTRHQLVK